MLGFLTPTQQSKMQLFDYKHRSYQTQVVWHVGRIHITHSFSHKPRADDFIDTEQVQYIKLLDFKYF